tara:strand:+ start:139 stop:819 length:681 start_codon:yes stop_codon:yes gene_type:complete
MKDLSLIRFKSEEKETPFAPTWDYTLVEGQIEDVDFDYIAKYLIEKKEEILKIKPSKGDGYTGLGKNSTTARHADYNIFNFGDEEINKLKSNILFLHSKLIGTIGSDEFNKYRCDGLYIQCWYNVMKKGERILPHLHDTESVCYLGGHITVQCDDTYTGYINPVNQISKPDIHESKNKVGKLTLFPNYLPHFTNKHNGDKERITIAFDLMTRKDHINNNYVSLINN